MMSAMQICQGVFVIVCCMILGWGLLFFCVTRFLEFLFSNHHLLFLKFVCLVMVTACTYNWIFGSCAPFLVYLELQLMNLLHNVCCMPFCYLKTID
ncbi:unnamed protein product [Coffea canephora]|uniref:Uncharacterized protein n=1 Tax=Coffea canephora TaxID=49390 RepID=A0A068U9H5_COFCA|nr:unnamed protein product [Coffea canephora]